MNTATCKTDTLLEEIIYCDLRTEVGIDKAKTLIRRSLKEQDRDTRHACAEAVVAIPGETGDDLIDAGLAHAACMNVKAI